VRIFVIYLLECRPQEAISDKIKSPLVLLELYKRGSSWTQTYDACYTLSPILILLEYLHFRDNDPLVDFRWWKKHVVWSGKR